MRVGLQYRAGKLTLSFRFLKCVVIMPLSYNLAYFHLFIACLETKLRVVIPLVKISALKKKSLDR